MTRNILLGLMATFSLASTNEATAELYDYSSVVTLCTGTCDSFASLDIGSEVAGLIEIDTMPNGSFTDADVVDFTLEVFNPGAPLMPPVGDPINDNPIVFDLGSAAPNGTLGMTDVANELASGQILSELLLPPWSSNGAFLVWDLSSGGGQLCLFYETAGCIPGATQAARFEGAFTFLAPYRVTPTAIDFDQVVVGGEAQADIFIDQVVGGVVDIGLIDGLTAPFSISQDNCSLQTVSVPPCTVTVRFQPTGPGAFSDTLFIPSDDLDNPLVQVSVTGEGLGGVIFSDGFE